MVPRSHVSKIWEEPAAAQSYTTGVSLHGHTSASAESLTFIHKLGLALKPVARLTARYERRSRDLHGLELDFVSAHWRPPLLPRMAFELEAKQIEALGLCAMVSLTDHDTLEAPLLLRTLPEARTIPVSLEWTTPFGTTAFHLGIHNLPSADAATWMACLAHFTAAPSEARLHTLLRELDSIPQVLIVLNHPLWDLYRIGPTAHRAELDRFLAANGRLVHALELNGLRHARENRAVLELARQRGYVVLSGGDRHGLEPNANINLTNAQSFTEFVREVREDRVSHVLFMEQYRRPWEQRILASTLDAVTEHKHFSPGWQRWDERVFHKDRDGVLRPMAELWVGGRPPRALTAALWAVKLLRYPTCARALSMAFAGVNRGELDSLQGQRETA